MSFFTELRRRNVIRVGFTSAVVAWLLLQMTEVLVQLLELPVQIGRIVVLLLALGFVLALFFAWAYELMLQGASQLRTIGRDDRVEAWLGSSFWAASRKPLGKWPGFQRLPDDIGMVDCWHTAGFPFRCRPLSEEDFECD